MIDQKSPGLLPTSMITTLVIAIAATTATSGRDAGRRGSG